MKRLASLFAFLFLTLLVQAEIQEPTVVVYWNFAAYPNSVQSVSRVMVQAIPPFPKINGVYQIPAPIAFFPGTYPLITNGIVSTNVAVDTPLKVTFSGPFGSRSVTNFFPSVLTNGPGPYNAGTYDVQAIAQFNDYIIGVWFNGTNFLGAGLAPTNLTGAQGITIGGIYPNYIVGANGQIVTNMDTLAVALSNNFSANNITANTNLTVGQNTTTGGLTSGAITNTGQATNQLLFLSTGGQETTIPFSTVTNGVSAALTLLNTATSNALVAQVAAVGLNNSNYTAGVSNALVTQIATLGTASSSYVLTVSNSVVSQIAALGLNGTNFTLAQVAAVGLNDTNFTLTSSNSLVSQIAAAGVRSTNFTLSTSNGLAAQTAASGLAATNFATTLVTQATNSINAASLTGLAPVAVLPPATVSTLGVVRADNATITNVGGVLYAVNTNTGTLFSISGDGVLITNTITHSGSFATVPAAGFTFLGGPQGAGPGQPSYQPYSNMTNGVDAALRAFNIAASNSLVAQIATVGLNNSNYTASVSNSVVAQLATIGLAGSNYTIAVSNSLVAQIAALGLASTNYTLAQVASVGVTLTNFVLTASNSLVSQIAASVASVGLNGSNYTTGVSNSLISQLATLGTGTSNYVLAVSNSVVTQLAALGLTLTNYVNTKVAQVGLNDTNFTLSTSNGIVAQIAGQVAAAGQATTNYASNLVVSATNTINGASLVAGPVPVGVLPVATAGSLGIGRPDNSTLSVSGGVWSATGIFTGVPQLPSQFFTNANGQLAITPGYATTNPAVVGSTQYLPGTESIQDSSGIWRFWNPNGAGETYFGTSPGATNADVRAGEFIGGLKVVGTVTGFPGSAISSPLITNVPGTNRFYDNIGRLQVDTNLNVLGTMQINGSNAATGQILTALDGAGHVKFLPAAATGNLNTAFTNFQTTLITTSNSIVLVTNQFPGTNVTFTPTNIAVTGGGLSVSNATTNVFNVTPAGGTFTGGNATVGGSVIVNGLASTNSYGSIGSAGTNFSSIGTGQMILRNPVWLSPSNMVSDFVTGPVFSTSSSIGYLIATNVWPFTPLPGTNLVVGIHYSLRLSYDGNAVGGQSVDVAVSFTNSTVGQGFSATVGGGQNIGQASITHGYFAGTTGYSIWGTNSSSAAGTTTSEGNLGF